MTPDEIEVRRRIDALVDSVRDDQRRSNQLFLYVWSMMCVHRGLMRVVREVTRNGTSQLLLEEVRTGNCRLVVRPDGIDSEVEGLAVQALSRLLFERRRAG